MKKGFTLAEVLITLGIVGVVAVLTIPAVMKDYKKRLYVAQLEKTYAQLSDAVLAAMNDEHADNFYETRSGSKQNDACATGGECTQGLGYFLNTYFEPDMKNCGKGAKLCLPGTGPDAYKTISGVPAGSPAGGNYCIQTSRGATICGSLNSAVEGDPNRPCLSLAIDVNGAEGPNIIGRDLFVMDVHSDGAISDYASGCSAGSQGCTADKCNTDSGPSIYDKACGCLTSVMEAGWKMEY